MERPITLIVLLMFTAIVGIGVGNILMNFAGMVARIKTLRGYGLSITWLLILLVSFLDMFWSSGLLTLRENWNFGMFLYIISGPVVLLFASSLMVSLLQEESNDGSKLSEQEESVLSRFFFLYAVSQVWRIGVEAILNIEWSYLTVISVMLAIASASMVVIKELKFRWLFTIMMAVLILGDVVIQTIS